MNDEKLSATAGAPEDRELQSALQEARGDELSAAELRQMRDTLLRRRSALAGDLESATDEVVRVQLKKQLDELDEHIAILHEEATLTGFVEDSVRFGLEMRRLNEG